MANIIPKMPLLCGSLRCHISNDFQAPLHPAVIFCDSSSFFFQEKLQLSSTIFTSAVFELGAPAVSPVPNPSSCIPILNQFQATAVLHSSGRQPPFRLHLVPGLCPRAQETNGRSSPKKKPGGSKEGKDGRFHH